MKEVLLYIWQLPQNLLGLFLLLYYKHEKEYYRHLGRVFYHTKEMPSGISLGNYIIMNREDKREGMKHEFGHTIQSRRQGWFYLLITGLPSLIGNILSRIFKWSDKKYYNQPWEKRADKLGGVVRKYE